MAGRFTRRRFLTTTGAGLLATTMPVGMRLAFGADGLQALTWGGMWLDGIKAITDKQDIPVQWNTFPAGGSNSIVALTRASWPKAPYDITANWDPVWSLMNKEGWLEPVTEADVPNLADVPPALRVYSDTAGTYGIPYSLAAFFWGYRSDLVDFEIKTLDDLLDPRLKGKICISNTSKFNGLIQVSMALANGGDEKNMEPGWAFQKKLIESGNVGRWSNTDVDMINSVNTGETAVAFGGSANWNTIKENAPVVLLGRSEGKSAFKTYLYQEGYAIFKGPNADAAKKVINYMLSPENNQAYNDLLGQGPVNSKSKASAAAADISMSADDYAKYAYFADYAYMGEQSDAWVKLWERDIQPLIRG
jgi:putative spermidine/putrescine transport system substrate-binding protein